LDFQELVDGASGHEFFLAEPAGRWCRNDRLRRLFRTAPARYDFAKNSILRRVMVTVNEKSLQDREIAASGISPAAGATNPRPSVAVSVSMPASMAAAPTLGGSECAPW
jgi:hypothetical protein